MIPKIITYDIDTVLNEKFKTEIMIPMIMKGLLKNLFVFEYSNYNDSFDIYKRIPKNCYGKILYKTIMFEDINYEIKQSEVYGNKICIIDYGL